MVDLTKVKTKEAAYKLGRRHGRAACFAGFEEFLKEYPEVVAVVQRRAHIDQLLRETLKEVNTVCGRKVNKRTKGG